MTLHSCRQVRWLALGISVALLAGCDTAAKSSTQTTAPPAATQPATATGASTTPVAEDKATPDPSAPPDFVIADQAHSGDKLKIEGRFGPVLPANESDVDSSVLGECPQVDGRELVTRLDLTTTIQSSLSAQVALTVPEQPASDSLDFVMGNTDGAATCGRGASSSEEAATASLGILEPHEPSNFTMWVVLLDAITPGDPHPSMATLAHQQWLMGMPVIYLNKLPASGTIRMTGRRIVTCHANYHEYTYIALAGGAPQTINPGDPKNELLCSE